jgi:hypothetical protein
MDERVARLGRPCGFAPDIGPDHKQRPANPCKRVGRHRDEFDSITSAILWDVAESGGLKRQDNGREEQASAAAPRIGMAA